MLRGGAYKPRTSPYAFQRPRPGGPAAARGGQGSETGLPIVTELMDVRDLEAVLEVADVIQIGARNMQNYTLLTRDRAHRASRRCSSAACRSTLEELLMAAEYILKEGNERVMLCERGIRTFETAYRFTLDLTAIPVLKELSHLPVIVDPSHAAGPPRPRRAALAGRRRGGRRRHHRRGPPAPRGGHLRRAAAAPRPRVRRVRREGRAGRRARRQVLLALRRGVNVAVVGVGLIGGSIALAARDRLGRDVRESDPAGGLPRGRARGVDAAAPSPRRSTGRTSRSSPRRSASLATRSTRCSPPRPRDCVVSDVGSVKAARPAARRPRASSAATRSPAPSSAGASTRAPTSSTARPGT